MNRTKPSEEQLKYASLLQFISLGGLAFLVLGFLVYVSGLLPSIIPINEISQYWSLGVHEFVRETGIPTGWNWVALLNHGDMVSFLSIALLAAATPVCFAMVLPGFLRKKDIFYVVIILIQILVLFLAASGIVTRGH